jgi:hypothetical protein
MFNAADFDVAVGDVTVKADGINDLQIDFGTGANQVSTDDVPEGSTNKYNPFGPGVDSTDVAADNLSEDDINWRRRLIGLSMFHGKSSPLEDSIYLMLPQHNLSSFWPASDSAGDITVGDDDTLFASTFFEEAVTLDSLIIFYKNKNANSSIVKYTLWGPDRTDGSNVGDSCYYGALDDSTTARTATAWTRVAIDINDVIVNPGEAFGIKFIDDFQADYAVVSYGRCAFVVKK